jgi:hypothetical protein
VGTKAPKGSWKSIDSSGRGCVRVVSEPGTVCIFQAREEKEGKEGYSDTHDLCQGGIRVGVRVLFGWIVERRRYNATQKGDAIT